MKELRSHPIDAVIARMRYEIDLCRERAESEIKEWKRHAAAMEEIAVAAAKVAVNSLRRTEQDFCPECCVIGDHSIDCSRHPTGPMPAETVGDSSATVVQK